MLLFGALRFAADRCGGKLGRPEWQLSNVAANSHCRP